MAKPKYSLETRLAVVSHYLSGNDGTQRTAQLFGVERTRLEAIAAKGEYESTGNYNSKASQQYADSYGQIVDLLNITSVDAQNQQQVKDAMVNYAMAQFGVDKATAENYIETYDGMKTVAASMTPVLGAAAVSKIDSLVAKYATNNQLSTGTVFDSIKATQPVHPGSVIPQSFEMSLPNGQKYGCMEMLPSTWQNMRHRKLLHICLKQYVSPANKNSEVFRLP